MLLYGAAVLVLLLNKNAAETSNSATTAVSPKLERAAFDKGELARLIHHVIEADNDAGENVDNGNGERKVTKSYGAAADPLDLSYFDLRYNGVLKSSSKEIMSLLKKNFIANEAQIATPTNRDYEVRVHLIKNPEVLEQYRKNLRKRHMYTSSSSSDDDSLEYDRNAESFIRRNAVFRLGKPSDQAFFHENPKFALRNGDDMGEERYKKHAREEEKGAEKIIVSFKENKLDDYNDKPRHSDTNKQNRNKNNYNDEPAKKDVWDDITKNAYKWDNKEDKNSDTYKKHKYNDEYKNDNYKNNDEKRDGYDNHKKEKNDDYISWNSKASKQKNEKSNDRDKKMDWDKPKKENSWDNWKSKSMEQADSHKRVKNSWDEPKKTDDWDRSKKNNDWDKPKKNDEWDRAKKNEEWDTPKKNDEWDKFKKNDEWDKPKKNDEWDKSKKNEEWDKPKKSNDWDKPNNDDSWNRPKKATKGISSFERDLKNDYREKAEFKREETKRTTNEWDRAVANSGGGSGVANKKPFKPKISDYYNPRPRIHENQGVLGFKSFGRTSIPFVGKKGIYEEK